MKVTGYRVGSRMKVEIIGSAAEFSDFIQALTYDTKTEEVDTAKETARKIRRKECRKDDERAAQRNH